MARNLFKSGDIRITHHHSILSGQYPSSLLYLFCYYQQLLTGMSIGLLLLVPLMSKRIGCEPLVTVGSFDTLTDSIYPCSLPHLEDKMLPLANYSKA